MELRFKLANEASSRTWLVPLEGHAAEISTGFFDDFRLIQRKVDGNMNYRLEIWKNEELIFPILNDEGKVAKHI